MKSSRFRLIRQTLVLGCFALLALVARGNSLPAVAVRLAWLPSTSADVVGYNLYYGTASGTYTNVVSVGNVTNATISGLTAGTVYFFVATTRDNSGNESDYSGEISYKVPAPGLSPGFSELRGMTSGCPLALGIRFASDGQIVLEGKGPPGQTLVVQATRDLEVWTIVGSVTANREGTFQLPDGGCRTNQFRFYRLQDSP